MKVFSTRKKKIVAVTISILVVIALILGAVEIYMQFTYGSWETRKTMAALGDGIEEFKNKVENPESDNRSFEEKYKDNCQELSNEELFDLAVDIGIGEFEGNNYVKLSGLVFDVDTSNSYASFKMIVPDMDNSSSITVYVEDSSKSDITLNDGISITIYGFCAGVRQIDIGDNSPFVPCVWAEYIETAN